MWLVLQWHDAFCVEMSKSKLLIGPLDPVSCKGNQCNDESFLVLRVSCHGTTRAVTINFPPRPWHNSICDSRYTFLPSGSYAQIWLGQGGNIKPNKIWCGRQILCASRNITLVDAPEYQLPAKVLCFFYVWRCFIDVVNNLPFNIELFKKEKILRDGRFKLIK